MLTYKKSVFAVVTVVVLTGLDYFVIPGGGADSVVVSHGCTPKEYAKKVSEIRIDMIDLGPRDPVAFEKAMVKMREATQKMAKNTDDFGEACEVLDEIAAMVKK